MNSIYEKDSLERIASDVRQCRLCDLSKTRKNTVPGEGNFKKKLIIIGEAPGFNEDQKGRPFIGMAGKVLRDALKRNDISIDDVFITNIVKCRPPNNRQPNICEKDLCLSYLERQINLLKPKIICLLGNVASSYILMNRSVTTNRGEIIEENGLKYFITYHPAATMYNRNLFHLFEKDIKKLASILTVV